VFLVHIDRLNAVFGLADDLELPFEYLPSRFRMNSESSAISTRVAIVIRNAGQRSLNDSPRFSALRTDRGDENSETNRAHTQ